MNRRSFLSRSLVTLSAPFASTLGAAEDPERFLGPTRYIDSTHPSILAAVASVAEAGSDIAQARAIHDFVRDRIRFGFASSFYDQTHPRCWPRVSDIAIQNPPCSSRCCARPAYLRGSILSI
jgi:hypothetical protein